MFKDLKKQVQLNFQKMCKDTQTLFVTDVDRDALWEAYLNGFEDPIIRQEHNCNCCRSFIKHYGNLVSIKNGIMTSIWNFDSIAEYKKSVAGMHALILQSSVRDVFVSTDLEMGTNKNTSSTGVVWEHFYCSLPAAIRYRGNDTIGSAMGSYKDDYSVLQRSLTEIKKEAVDIVLELIEQNSLYKGVEYKHMLTEYRKVITLYEKAENKDLFVWEMSRIVPQTVSRIKNVSIGTLLLDLSEGKELDQAVTSFERMVAPSNYKRPTAIVTKAMIEQAEKTIIELGLQDTLGRRYAVRDDISVNDVLFANRSSSEVLGILGELKEDLVVNPKTLSKVEEISVDKFMDDVLPNASSIEVLVENSHMSNFTTLIAPKVPDAPGLFKWNNPFSWSYVNALSDSMKERVKAAGGNVDGVLRFSLQWNEDGASICDLDLHAHTPKDHIYYGHKEDRYTGGALDVDMIRPRHTGIENIIWKNLREMKPGDYNLQVRNYCGAHNTGFSCEIEFDGEIHTFVHDKKLSGVVSVATVNLSTDGKFTIKSHIPSSTKGGVSKEKWGIKTNVFHKVSMVLNSPNFWNGSQIGNKHLFFIIEGVKCDESPRGFFNEFLKDDLDKHRKVFELLGSKLKVEDSDEQLSGLGFSVTQRNTLYVKVKGSFERVIKVIF